MAGMLGCGCCGPQNDPTCTCGYGSVLGFPGPGTTADFNWSYTSPDNLHVLIRPDEIKTKHVRDGRLYRHRQDNLAVEVPPSRFAGKYYETEPVYLINPPLSILMTEDNSYKTHNFLFATEASVSPQAALIGGRVPYQYGRFVPMGDVYTVGNLHHLGNSSYAGNWYHGIMIKQFRSGPGLNGSEYAVFGTPSLWYVVFYTSSGLVLDPDGISKVFEKPIAWGTHTLEIGIETPEGEYQFNDSRMKNNFYLDGSLQYTISFGNPYGPPQYPFPCSNQMTWKGCVTMFSSFWEPRITGYQFFPPAFIDRYYYVSNPINSRWFDNITFTKKPKPLLR